jgi:hypothetical protein
MPRPVKGTYEDSPTWIVYQGGMCGCPILYTLKYVSFSIRLSRRLSATVRPPTLRETSKIQFKVDDVVDAIAAID